MALLYPEALLCKLLLVNILVGAGTSLLPNYSVQRRTHRVIILGTESVLREWRKKI